MTELATNVIALPAPSKPACEIVSQTGPTVRTIARQQGIDIASLISILEYMRPDESQTEQDFVDMYLGTIPGMNVDGYGNHYITIGEDPIVLWSCHTDTVSSFQGKQNVKWDGNFLKLNQPKSGQCLGADDGAGLWLMLEMIKAERPGLYVFHRAEEVGCKGSRYIASKSPELLKGIKMAIAFDRKGVDSVITRQSTGRCCSDEFGKSLAEALNKVEGLKYDLDPTGVYTDTAHYIDLVGECTNLSVGYYSQHGTTERLDVAHMLRLREALLQLDVSELTLKREPGEEDDDDYYGYGGYGSRYGGYSYSKPKPKATTELDELDRLAAAVKERPFSVAKMLHAMGMTADMLEDMGVNVWLRQNDLRKEYETKARLDASHQRAWGADSMPSNADLADAGLVSDYALWCDDCCDFDNFAPVGTGYAGSHCGNCGGCNTDLIEVTLDPQTGDVVEF